MSCKKQKYSVQTRGSHSAELLPGGQIWVTALVTAVGLWINFQILETELAKF